MRYLWIVAIVALCLAGTLSCVGISVQTASRPCHGESVAQVPFLMFDDHIFLTVTVNDAADLNMILDTGMGSAGAILLDPELGEELELEYVTEIELGGGGAGGAKSAWVAGGASLSLSDLRFEDQQLLVMEEEVFEGHYADGIIGGTLFSDYAVGIDYDLSVLDFYRDLGRDPSGYGHEFDLTFSYGIPVVDALLDLGGGSPVPVKLLVDTGVNDPLLIFTYSDERLDYGGPVIEGVERLLSEGLTGAVRGPTGRIPMLKVGPFVMNDVVASFPDEETMGPALVLGQNGMLGNEVLERFTVVFDYPESRMFLTPNDQHTRPFEYNTAGLVLEIQRAGYRVKDVIKDSPADREGIRGGDLIVEINGRPVGGYTGSKLGQIFTDLGATVELTFERGAERFTRTLPLKRLI